MANFVTKVKEELLAALPPTIFFYIALHIVALVRVLMQKGTGLAPLSTVSILVAALILGKSVLIADMLPIINRFPEKPLIYNVVWKTAIYVVASIFVHYLEHVVPVWWHMGSFRAANEHIWGEIVWSHFWGIQIWLVVLIFLYCLARELIRVIGRDQVRKILFGRVAFTLGARSQ